MTVRLHRPGALWYYGLLRDKVTRLDIWRTTYFHVLKGGPQAVVEWFRGSGLRPYLDALDEVERADFLARYRGGDRKPPIRLFPTAPCCYRFHGCSSWRHARA